MKDFMRASLLFLTPILGLFCLGIFLPGTPRSSHSIFMNKSMKDSLLNEVTKPRIIFVGGSNISFGLNGQPLRDSLCVNPVDTSIDAGIGLIYMLDDVEGKLQEGDVVVLIPEYQHFFGDAAYGSEDLLRYVLEASASPVPLRPRLAVQMIRFLPRYSLSKLNPLEYFSYKINDVYNTRTYNVFGNADIHWNLTQRPFKPFTRMRGKPNERILEEIKSFQSRIQQKGARLLISFPAIQEKSYQNIKDQIDWVESEYQKNGFEILGSASAFRMPDSLMFNTPYHLLKDGVDRRTFLLMTLLKPYVSCDRM